jgi:cobalamin biosynthesis protein CobD/CbiB
VNLKEVLGWLAIGFVVALIIERPNGAAHVVHDIGTFLTSAANSGSSSDGWLAGTWIFASIIVAVIIVVVIWSLIEKRKQNRS